MRLSERLFDRDDANLWSGVLRDAMPRRKGGLEHQQWSREQWEAQLERRMVPTLVVTLRLRYWSLPLTFSVGGHLLSKPGCTIGCGPFYFSWSRM